MCLLTIYILIKKSHTPKLCPGSNGSKGTAKISKGANGTLRKNNLRIALLNINSINDRKFRFCSSYISRNNNTIYALTELVAESGHTLDRFLNNHSSYPIISDPETRRVGITIPKFLYKKFRILDTWFLLQKRERNSQKICHTTTYQYSDKSSDIVFTVVYIAPDANDASYRALCDKMLDYSQQYKNYFFLGDLNRNQKLKEHVDFFNVHLGGYFEQMVSKITREKSRVTKTGNKSTSNTIIDLIFVKPQIKDRIKGINVNRNSPSDHFQVEIDLDISIPLKYTTYTFFRDPTRRQPIKMGKLAEAITALENHIKFKNLNLDDISHSSLQLEIQDSITVILDKYAPFNKAEQYTKTVYRRPLSRAVRKLRRTRLQALSDLRIAKSKNATETKIEDLKSTLKAATSVYKAKLKIEKKHFDLHKMSNDIANSKHVWEFINNNKPSKFVNMDNTILEIDGKTKHMLAEHMAIFLYKRAHLVSDSEALSQHDCVPFPNFSVREEISLDEKSTYDIYDLLKTRSKPSLACGPDSISHRHIMDLMPALEKPLQAMVNKPLDKFVNLSLNFSRLISKTGSTKGTQEFNDKCLRPIVEANILPKYTSIKIFIDQIKSKMIPFLNENQYSFPGKGTPVALTKILDKLNMLANQKKWSSLQCGTLAMLFVLFCMILL